MKKLIFFLSALALLGMASCTQPQEINPNFNPETNEVKTAFAFNIMTSARTKATADQVQESGNFLGMTNMYVYAFDGVPADASATATSYSLGSLSVDEIGNTAAKPSSKIYNLAIKTGTNNMIFYGKANSTYGDIKAPTLTATTTLGNDANWALVSILGSNDFTTPAGQIAAKLNAVITTGWAGIVAYLKANPTHASYADYKTLVDLYDNLTVINTGEIRQGSGHGVCAMVKDLYNALKMFVSTASTTGFTDAGTSYDSPKVIAQAVIDAIGTKFTVNTNATSGVVTVQLGGTLDNFPTSLGLPAGAAQLSWNTTSSAFEYVTAPGAFNNTTVSAIAKFMKPAALCYWVDSPILVSSYENLTADNYPKTTSTWSADVTDWNTGSSANWAVGAVSAETRGVALKNNIQYADAMLKSTIQYVKNDATTASFKLNDNRKHFMPLEEDQQFNITDNPFEFKGIIIGGQPQQVGWNWIPKTAASANSYVIYDVTNSTQAALPITTDSQSSPLYTLVLDNYTATTADAPNQADIAVAIELVNKTGKNIWGKENMIPIDGTFYLVGALKAANLPAAATFTGDNTRFNKDTRAPHLTTSDFVPRIFMQDYVTVANFKIDENSLKNAYSTIPDLRSTMMTFGISVDLQWLAGGTFDVQL